ncbi:hypothetical protein [uncultured Sulfitobacter sp.]|uniref:lipopolysaccharide biosynthesis protein n=1 Tax=uncultured Sulfitobacter sp. TaxID=191468 RepID=UPI0030D92691|tara:strand:- start:59166 stop:60455 length:1290 start_codon:yes stop_codon:yes gene_type:complete
MFRTILKYSASNGLQRAISFLASLLFLKVYSAADVGEYVLMQTIAQLIIPLSTLNITVALTREAKNEIHHVSWLLKYLSCGIFGVYLFVALIFTFAGDIRWICAAAMLGLSEALYNSLVAFLMGRENSTEVLKISLLRIFVFFILLIATYMKVIDIQTFITVFSVFLMSMALFILGKIIRRVQLIRRLKAQSQITISTMYGYSIATLPHTAALWVSISSDRMLLGSVYGKAMVGEYAIAFTLSQTVMVLLAGVISAMPPKIMNDIENWLNPQIILGFIRKIAIASFGITALNLLVFYANNRFINIVPNSQSTDLITLALISSGFFLSLFYVFFASYLYQRRNTRALTWSGFWLLPFNLAIFYALIHMFGKPGAAIGLMLAYISFGMAYGAAATRLIPELRQVIMPITLICAAQIGSSVLLAALILELGY